MNNHASAFVGGVVGGLASIGVIQFYLLLLQQYQQEQLQDQLNSQLPDMGGFR